jgi:DNA-binding CsgD family transcriptional regulator
VVQVLADVHAVLPVVGPAQSADLTDPATALNSLGAAWRQVFVEVTTVMGGAGARRGAELVALLSEIKQAEETLTLERIRRRDEAYERVREALAQLSGCGSTEELLDRAATAVCSTGYDRAIVSRVDGSSWIPEKVWVGRDRQWAEDILAAGRAHRQTLDRSVVETEMVRRRIGILVHDVQARDAVHRPIADVSRSQSYAAVPLIRDGGVIGFVHCDCFYQQRDLDEFDRQLLSLFAEGLSQALGRTSVLDQLGSIRNGFDQLSTALADVGGNRMRAAVPVLGGASVGSGSGEVEVEGGEARRERLVGEQYELTRREIEVLRLMAEGDTNGRIARRLVISEGTVKSHVKQILRKLRAGNRAEAVSRWLGVHRGVEVGPPRGPR